MNQCRGTYGEFHHVYKDLRQHPDRFFKFLRMSVETFDFLVSKIMNRITKKTTNFKKTYISYRKNIRNNEVSEFILFTKKKVFYKYT